MSPTTPGHDPRDDRDRRERAAARRGRRDRVEDSDPYGWSTVQPGMPPGPGRGPAGPVSGPPHDPAAPVSGASGGRTRRRGVDDEATARPPRSGRRPTRGDEPPVRRLLSIAIAGLAGLLTVGLVLGAQTAHGSYAFVVFGVQLLFVLAWTMAVRPPGPRVVAAVGLFTAAVGDIAAVWPRHPSLAPVAGVVAAGFVVGVLGQLARRGNRAEVTESLGSTLVVVVGVAAFAALIVLSRHPLGTQATVACLAAAGTAIVVARLGDVVVPSPRTAPQVPRGAIGVVAGAMAGTAAAAAVGSALVGLSPQNSAIAGLVTALAAVISDLAAAYGEAGRRLAGEPPTFWMARHMLGPLGAFALAAPVAYTLSVLVLVKNLG
ncbi:MAG TPA: hypothetical protein VF054_15240 [Micromonosporaceae bacterium]